MLEEFLGISASAIEKQIRKHYGVIIVGRIDSIVERIYAISMERRLKHPAVVTVSK